MRTSPAAERARRAHRRYGTRQDVPGMGTFLGTTLLRPGAAHQTQGLPRQSQGTSQPQCWQRCRSPGCARRSGARPVPPVPRSPSPRATGKAGGRCCATSQVKRGAEGPSPIHKPLLSLHCCCFPRPCGFFSKSNSNFSSQQRGRLNAQERPSRTRSPGPGWWQQPQFRDGSGTPNLTRPSRGRNTIIPATADPYQAFQLLYPKPNTRGRPI